MPRDYTQSEFRNIEKKPLSEPIALKIVTYNIQDTWVVGQNRTERMYAIAKKLIELDPDIVGFQEAFISKDREILINELTTKSRLKYYKYYRSGFVGSGLLTMSAFPICEGFYHRYKRAGNWYRLWEGDWWAGKGCALARIELPGIGFLDFYNTHMQAGYGNENYRPVKEAQAKELAEFINVSSYSEFPTILVGDLNTRPGDIAHENIVEIACLERIMSIVSRIDHIYAKKGPDYQFEVLETIELSKGIGPSGKSIRMSDHNGYMTHVKIIPLKNQKQ